MVTDTSFKRSVLVVPFETKMYMSQIDRQICNRHQISFENMVDIMRKNLADIVAFKLEDVIDAYSLMQPGKDSLEHELHYTYTSVNYVYRAMPEEKKETAKDSSRLPVKIKIGTKGEKTNTKPKTENGIQNGQIIAEEDPREKFMDADIINPKLLNELSGLYHSTWFVFINQLDLLYSPESTDQIRIKVHYSIFNENGTKKYAGAAISKMPSSISDLSTIKNDYFYAIATEITDKFRSALKTP